MRKVWYHQIWIQNYLGFIVSDLTYIPCLTFEYSSHNPEWDGYSWIPKQECLWMDLLFVISILSSFGIFSNYSSIKEFKTLMLNGLYTLMLLLLISFYYIAVLHTLYELQPSSLGMMNNIQFYGLLTYLYAGF